MIALPDRHYSGVWNFNPELVANQFAHLAAASHDVYQNARNSGRAFYLGDNIAEQAELTLSKKTGWQLRERIRKFGGLEYDVYASSNQSTLEILVAYRGTDQWLGLDMISNLSWLTSWINPFDQYRMALASFKDILDEASLEADGRTLIVMVTGHSLGGGLAQHIAYHAPCINAVTFNPSFVTKPARDRIFQSRIVRIYEDGDAFESFQKRVNNDGELSVYRMKLSNPDGIIYNHSMERLTAGMARMAVDCLKNTPGCEISDGAKLPKILYCQRYLGARKVNDSICN
jgi:pimeloyl-ACP methyl ester carboxylesterase